MRYSSHSCLSYVEIRVIYNVKGVTVVILRIFRQLIGSSTGVGEKGKRASR
jgi:hypothetical protein